MCRIEEEYKVYPPEKNEARGSMWNAGVCRHILVVPRKQVKVFEFDFIQIKESNDLFFENTCRRFGSRCVIRS